MKNLLLVSLVLLTPAAAQDSQARSDSSSSSHTKRVVVVNGKTVVDEETRDGKPVRGSQRGAAPVDLDRLLKDLEQDLGKGKTSSSSSSSSHSKRVVVVNGKTIIDEETRDGEPVRGKGAKARDLDAELDRLLKELEKQGGTVKRSSSSSSSSDRASSKDKDGGRLRKAESKRSAEAERLLRELEAELKKRSKDKPKETKGKTVVR